ncbi:MAG: hypothetical protein K6T65_11730 [Peptococcaceae bacterium]|nr:hypothetical protein [Peptococcaceae bacterium]
MRSKLKSRKFWMAVVTAAIVVCNQGLDLNLPEEAVYTVAGVVVAFILGESYVDANK